MGRGRGNNMVQFAGLNWNPDDFDTQHGLITGINQGVLNYLKQRDMTQQGEQYAATNALAASKEANAEAQQGFSNRMDLEGLGFKNRDLAEQMRHNRAMEGKGTAGSNMQFGIDMSKVSGPEDIYKTIGPVRAAQVKGLLDYTYNPNNFSLRNNEKGMVTGIAKLIDPTYDQAQFPNRSKLVSELTSGNTSRSIKSFNTIPEHLESAEKAFDKLGNVDFKAANWVQNAAKDQFSNAALAELKMSLNAVDNELATVFKNTSGTDQEIQAWRGSLNPNMGPQAFKAAIRKGMELVGARVGAIKNQSESSMGRPIDYKFLNDNTAKIFSKYGVDPGAIDSRYSGGAVEKIKDAGGKTTGGNLDKYDFGME